MGYELTSLEVRRDSAIILFLRDIFNSEVESVSLSEKISFYIPPRIGRKRNNLLNLLSCRTKQFESASLNRAQVLYYQIDRIDDTIDIFFDSRSMFKRKIQEALLQRHWDTT